MLCDMDCSLQYKRDILVQKLHFSSTELTENRKSKFSYCREEKVQSDGDG